MRTAEIRQQEHTRHPVRGISRYAESHAFFVGVAPLYHTICNVLAAMSSALTSQHAMQLATKAVGTLQHRAVINILCLAPSSDPTLFEDRQRSCISSFTVKRFPFHYSHIEEVANLVSVRADLVMVMIGFITHRFFFASLVILLGMKVLRFHIISAVSTVSSHCFETWNDLASRFVLLLL